MKRISAITLGLWLLVAQVVYLGQPLYSAGVGSVPKCCARVKPSIAPVGEAGLPVVEAVPGCCHRSCCARKSEPNSQSVPLVPVAPESPRFVPNGVLFDLAWALPSPQDCLASAVVSSYEAPRQPSVPVFTRHCAWLI